jgi:spore germination protein YaaH
MTQALQEANAQKKGLESVQIFAVYFDRMDRPFLPERIESWIEEESAGFLEKFSQEPKGVQIPVHLSIVNDIYDPKGSDFKNSDLVSRLLRDSETRARHIADLLAILSRWPFDGLEIDYERVRAEDWKSFLDFCGELHAELKARNKVLRVILEPQERFYASPFPEGPEYVIMAYNLFGAHSGPGPKANPKFIRRIASWVNSMETKPRLALATGGFIWDEGQKPGKQAQSLTESEAHLLYQREGITPERDPASGYLVFKFPSDSKNPKTVWFADGETLAFLADAARQSGFADFALWSFAGNRRYSLDQWKNEAVK